MIAYSCGSGLFIYGSMRASKQVHRKLSLSILSTTFRFLDKTPMGRIITRFTRDIRAIDGSLPGNAQETAEITSSMLLKLLSIVLLTPAFLLPGIAFAAIGGLVGQIYIRTQLPVRRYVVNHQLLFSSDFCWRLNSLIISESSNSRSSLIGHLSTSMAGLITIRAYGAEETFIQESLRRIDSYMRPTRSFYNLNR
jgi:ABC-type multidrug transport system fused ATPase/permease subunit